MPINTIASFTLGAGAGIAVASALGFESTQKGLQFVGESIEKLVGKTTNTMDSLYQKVTFSNLAEIALTVTITNYMLKNWIAPQVKSIISTIHD